MYCNRCGKEIESGNICDACAAAAYRSSVAEKVAKENEKTNVSYAPLEEDAMPDPKNRMYGFGKALTATILSEVGAVLAVYALLFTGYGFVTAFSLILSLATLPFIIIPIIFGISSIKAFMERKATCAKPIPALILGIVGLSNAAASAMILFFAFVITAMLI